MNTTTETRNLTKEEVETIIEAVIGFCDDYGMLKVVPIDDSDESDTDDSFTLQDQDGETIECLYEGAVANGVQLEVYEKDTGEIKYITALKAVNVASLV